MFTALSFWMFTGLAVLTAGILAALQYLRVRPRQVRIITTLFWQQAADQARARTLFKRFRYPRTYLLLLAAALLALLALANPIFTTQQPDRVIVLEAGLAMTAGDQRFDKARALVRAEAASLGEERVAVITADPHPRLLKHFDESLVALEDRLPKVRPADVPVIREDVLQAAKSLLGGREQGEVVLVAAEPVAVEEAGVRVLAAGEVMDNAFILSAVFVPDSGDLTRGAFHVRVGYTGKQPGLAKVTISRADQVLVEDSIEFKPGAMRTFTAPGLAADGHRLTVSVTGRDLVAGDSQIDYRLPSRGRIRVVPVDGTELPRVFTSILQAMPEVVDEASNGSVIRVGPPGSDAQILIQPAEGGENWGPVRPSHHLWLGRLNFEDAVCRSPAIPLKVSEGDSPLLLVNDTLLAALNEQDDRLIVSDLLFDRDANLTRRTAYLVFWSKMLHHLAGWRGEPLTLSPVQADRSVNPGSDALTLKAGMSQLSRVADGAAAPTAQSQGPRFPAWQWLLAGALVLMTLEAVLHVQGRIL